MKTLKIIISQRQYAIVIGTSILLMAILAGVAYGYVFNTLVIKNDGYATQNAILSAKNLFHIGLYSWIGIILCDLMVSVGIVGFYLTNDKTTAIATGLVRLIYTVILAVAVWFLGDSLNYLDNSPETILNQIQQFEMIWSRGLILFGFHLILWGFAAKKMAQTPKFWVIMLWIAGFGYILVHTLKGFPDLQELASLVEMILSFPMTLGEVGFAVWLLVKGGK